MHIWKLVYLKLKSSIRTHITRDLRHNHLPTVERATDKWKPVLNANSMCTAAKLIPKKRKADQHLQPYKHIIRLVDTQRFNVMTVCTDYLPSRELHLKTAWWANAYRISVLQFSTHCLWVRPSGAAQYARQDLLWKAIKPQGQQRKRKAEFSWFILMTLEWAMTNVFSGIINHLSC